MSVRLFKRHRTSAGVQPPSNNDDENNNDDCVASAADGSSSHRRNDTGTAISASRTPTRRQTFSAASGSALSSSYNLPSRSYVHTAGHGVVQDIVQYASPSVRDRTAELASSFLSESEMSRYFAPNADNPRTFMYQPHDLQLSEPGHETFASTGDSNDALVHSSFSRRLPESSLDDAGDQWPGSIYSTQRSKSSGHIFVTPAEDDSDPGTEVSPLLPRKHLPRPRDRRYPTDVDAEQQHAGEVGRWNRLGHHYPSLRHAGAQLQILLTPKAWDIHSITQKGIIEPVSMLPAVFLGVLLNLLDALSYGIILFPLGEEPFADLGPDGVSMFYVSCIISQLVYSTGSIFKGGVGSEMIEVVPFFHKMTYLIMNKMGTSDPVALRATVITSYAMSSIITGVVFLALGSARLGTLVNFFPHSILTGCIGGVGIFLFVTGVEVSARLNGNLELTLPVLEKLFSRDTIVLWIPPLILAVALLVIKRFYDRPWLVPAYYIAITAIFYIVTTAIPSVSMADLRSSGWVFEAPAAGVPFYNFYSYYKFGLVDWQAIWRTIPSQLALTFFGILHVPINVPNLAMVVQEDNVSINRELIMHGVSNTLSGCVGSIQNYLVFVNSVLFMNTGANSRLAGIMLAAATFGLWVAGPVVIGYVPVMVVGTLIYMLGIDLAVEALISTYGRLHRLEYFTIIVIALVMGLYDFVVGIAIGIGLACLVYVVQTSRKTVVRAEFSGTVAGSTVRRHPRHRSYLHKVGGQIRVVKLGGYLFFGSIVKVEKKVRALIDAETFAASPIRYLIVDFSHVSGIDFSASEAFNRMNRILHRREVSMAVAGVRLDSEVGRSLQMVGLFLQHGDQPSTPAPRLFEDLNSALEACENELLMVLTEKQRSELLPGDASPPMPIPDAPKSHAHPAYSLTIGSPRREMLHEEAKTVMRENPTGSDAQRWSNYREPLPLLMQALQGLSRYGVDFWGPAAQFFTYRSFAPGTVLYARGDRPDGFYLLQSGVLRAEYLLEQGAYHENIVAGTTCGELPFFSDTERTCTVIAERQCEAWLLDSEHWAELQQSYPHIATELLKVGMKLSAERMNAVTSYVLITAS